MISPEVRVVLLAGGGGERFWPSSRPEFPKQFLDLDGKGSLLQKTYQRALGLADARDIFVSTRREYADLVKEHIPALPPENLILEPVGRDTAPGLGLAATMLELQDPTAIMVALPADHLVTEESRFYQTIRAAVGAAAREQALVTLGVHPTRPETGYGYIQVGDMQGEASGLPVHRALRFVEKPDQNTALLYVQSGDYLWNSGMFIWPVGVLREEIRRHLPELDSVLAEVAALKSPRVIETALPELFPRAPRISIDYGVLERSDRVMVVPAYFGWDDVGSWTALSRLRPCDGQGNSARGPVVLHECKDVVIEGSGRVIAAVGLSDLIIIDTDDALLVCHKEHAQAVKAVSAQAEALRRELEGAKGSGQSGPVRSEGDDG